MNQEVASSNVTDRVNEALDGDIVVTLRNIAAFVRNQNLQLTCLSRDSLNPLDLIGIVHCHVLNGANHRLDRIIGSWCRAVIILA